eukprot:g3057.t1
MRTIVLAVFLLIPLCSTSTEVFVIGRSLLFQPTTLSDRLANNIITGNFDKAAEDLFNAVSTDNGLAIVQGFNAVNQQQGREFSIVQTLVRAFANGLDPDSLESTVHNSTDEAQEAEKVIHRVSTVINSTSLPPSISPEDKGYENLDPVIIEDQNFTPSEETRQCRGKKLIDCCNAVETNSPGCNCEESGVVIGPREHYNHRSHLINCRFVYENRNPLILRDTRRNDNWLCFCIFVPLGVLKSEPTSVNITEEDLRQLKTRVKEFQNQSDTSLNGSISDDEQMIEDHHKDIAVQNAKKVAKKSLGFDMDSEANEMVRELKLDEYDSEEDITGTSCLDNIVSSLPVEYSIVRDEEMEEELTEEEDSSDEDDMRIESTDVIILATKADEFLSSIEIWLYEEADDESVGNLLIHHDIPLASYPLCCEYLDVQPSGGLTQCNMIAIGGMKSAIEIYDLDILDPISPVANLTPPSRKKSKVSTYALSSNEKYRNILAAGCDDKRVRVWDLSQGVMTSELKLHKSSIQSVKWNPMEHSILLSGGHDKKCSLIDIRTPEGETLKWKLCSENEALVWSPLQSTCFLASDESGQVCFFVCPVYYDFKTIQVVMFDARLGSHSDAIFQLEAHKENTTVLSFSPLNPALFMTGSEDGKVIWNPVNPLVCIPDQGLELEQPNQSYYDRETRPWSW